MLSGIVALVVACNGVGAPAATPTPTTTPAGQPTGATGTATPPNATTPSPALTPAGTGTPAATTPTSGPPTPTDAGPTPGPSSDAELDLTLVATGETPEGWQEILSSDGHCRQAVPAEWYANAIPGSGLSDDTHIQSLVANDSSVDFEAEIVHLKGTYFTELSDSSQIILLENDELFLMREGVRGQGSHVVSMNGGPTQCGIIVAVDEVAAIEYRAIVFQILYTLAEVP